MLKYHVLIDFCSPQKRGILALLDEDGRLFYHCHLCEYQSARRDTIKNHIDRKHLLLRAYPKTPKRHLRPRSQCHICVFTTEERKRLRIHLKNVHNVELEPEIEAGVKVTNEGKTLKSAIDSETLLYEYLKHSIMQ